VNHPAWPNASLRSASLPGKPGSAAAMLRSIERLAAL
jgi:hypothetical protein